MCVRQQNNQTHVRVRWLERERVFLTRAPFGGRTRERIEFTLLMPPNHSIELWPGGAFNISSGCCGGGGERINLAKSMRLSSRSRDKIRCVCPPKKKDHRILHDAPQPGYEVGRHRVAFFWLVCWWPCVGCFYVLRFFQRTCIHTHTHAVRAVRLSDCRSGNMIIMDDGN